MRIVGGTNIARYLKHIQEVYSPLQVQRRVRHDNF